MNCEHCERKVPDLLVHRLDPKVASAVRLHLGSCGPCREYLERVRRLYRVPEPFRVEPGLGPLLTGGALALAPERPSRTRRAAAVGGGIAAALAVVALGVRVFEDGVARGRVPTPPSAQALATRPIRLDAPELPPPFRPGTWLASRADAERLSDYTGLPILEEYVWRECPRCRGMEEILRPQYLPVLDAFVLYRQVANDGLPDALRAQHPDRPEGSVYPALRVVEPACTTPATWAVDRLDTVEDLVADYYTECVAAQRDRRLALDPELFDWARSNLADVPALVAGGELREAFERLEETRALEERYRTRFAADARALEGQLVEALEERVAALEARAATTPRRGPAREALRAEAQALLERVRGLRFFERVEPLTR